MGYLNFLGGFVSTKQLHVDLCTVLRLMEIFFEFEIWLKTISIHQLGSRTLIRMDNFFENISSVSLFFNKISSWRKYF